MTTERDDGKSKRGKTTAKTAKPHLKVVASSAEAESAVTGEARLDTQAAPVSGEAGDQQQPRRTRIKSGRVASGLTAKQEAFALAVFGGSNFSDAYRQAYDAASMTPSQIHTEACMLVQHPKVSKRLEQLAAEKEQERRMQRLSRADRVIQTLEQIATGQTSADGTQVRALELLGKTMGLFVDRVETEDKTERDAETIRRDLEQRLDRLLG